MGKPTVGFVGVGGWANYAHAPTIKELGAATIAACADVDDAKRKAFSERYGCRAYSDYAEMIAKENPDVVVVAAPPTLHAAVALEALGAGAHVYLEKPMATSTEDAAQVARRAKAKRRIVEVGHEFRYNKSTLAAKSLASKGRLGRIYFARAFYIRSKGIPNSPTFTSKRLAGGGAVFDIGTHAIDLSLFLLGFPKPASVVSSVYYEFSERQDMRSTYPDPKGSFSKLEVEDSGAAFVKFEGGATLYVEVSWASYIAEDKQEVSVLGSLGGVHLDSRSLKYMFTQEGQFFRSEPLLPQTQRVYLDIWGDFLDAVEKGAEKPTYPACSAEEGVVSVAIMEAIYRAAASGRQENVDVPADIVEELEKSRGGANP